MTVGSWRHDASIGHLVTSDDDDKKSLGNGGRDSHNSPTMADTPLQVIHRVSKHMMTLRHTDVTIIAIMEAKLFDVANLDINTSDPLSTMLFVEDAHTELYYGEV